MTTMLSQWCLKVEGGDSIVVEERPFIKEAGNSSFKKSFQKLWYLLAFSPHFPNHKHLEVIKVKVNKLWSICLTKYKLAISSPLNTRATHHGTQLQPPVSSCHFKYMRIIDNRQWGTPCTWYGSYPITKMTRQADNEHLSDLFIYYLQRFLLRMLHRLLIMVMLQVSTMIRHGLG